MSGADVFTFADFEPAADMGSVAMTIGDDRLALWRRIYPNDPTPEGEVPAAFTTVILMHAWRTIVDPRPPGNVHAGQSVTVQALPRAGETVDTTVSCVSKEERKGRLFVKLATVSTGAGGRTLFSGQTNLIWAA